MTRETTSNSESSACKGVSSALRPEILGIVNVTPDSFSDGGSYLDAERAAAHAKRLSREGARWIDLGAASSHPRAPHVPAAEEIARLAPVLDRLSDSELLLSIDSSAPETQRYALSRGVAMLNDVNGFPHPEIYPQLADSQCKLVVMHRIEKTSSDRAATSGETLLSHILRFFEGRVQALEAAGIARGRLILDPGMGLFLGPRLETSLTVLRCLARLRRQLGLPLLVGISRKSLLSQITDGSGRARPPLERGAATLAAELYAAREGVDYIRTHDVRTLHDGLMVERALSHAAVSPEAATESG